MLLEHIGSRGRILAEILDDVRGSDSSKKQNLLRGISKITLALARTSHARIGSLRFNDDTFSTLETRPLFCANSILESEGVPRVVNRTYETERAFIEDMLRFREEAFRTQPNAVYDEEDCRLQMYHMVVLRAVHTLLVDYKFQGPYVLQLTDFHAGNIFVDEEWNITGIIDLEFICALPPSMMNVPYWLSVKAIDNIRENMAVVAKVHETYMNIFREEERHCTHEHDLQLSLSIQGAWESGACWLYGCITSIDGTPYFVEEHICEELGIRLSLDEEKRFAILMSHLWSRDSENIVRQKLHDKAEYDKAIVQHFSQELDMV